MGGVWERLKSHPPNFRVFSPEMACFGAFLCKIRVIAGSKSNKLIS